MKGDRNLGFIFKCNLRDYGDDDDDSSLWDKNCGEKISGEMEFDEKIAG